jgi:hypothetical protein
LSFVVVVRRRHRLRFFALRALWLQEARRAQGAGQAFAFPTSETAKAAVAALDVAEDAEPAMEGLAVARKSACWRVVGLMQSAGLGWAGLGWVVVGLVG